MKNNLRGWKLAKISKLLQFHPDIFNIIWNQIFFAKSKMLNNEYQIKDLALKIFRLTAVPALAAEKVWENSIRKLVLLCNYIVSCLYALCFRTLKIPF